MPQIVLENWKLNKKVLLMLFFILGKMLCIIALKNEHGLFVSDNETGFHNPICR